VIKFYAVSLALGVIGLVIVLFAGSLKPGSAPDTPESDRGGDTVETLLGVVVGFGIGGMSAEFSPLDFDWQVSLLVAAMAAAVSGGWVRYSIRRTNT
jgi:hypothetical protein